MLPNVQFTNNLGSIQFARCIIGVTDSWEFDGRVARHVKSVSIDGHILQGGLNEAFSGIISDITTNGRRYGDVGSLVLPWTTLNNIRMTDLSFPENVWIDYVPVQATFADDYPDGNAYTLSFFGLTIYNPRINLPIPDRQLRDQYPTQPLQYTTGFQVGEPRFGVFRTRAGQRNMDVSLTGAIRIVDMQLPANIIQTMTQRANMGTTTFTMRSPTGWPRTFNLGDAIPEVKADMNLAHCIVTGAQIQWRIEEQMANISINMLCPPQLLK